jgi:hypothetical protein
MQDPGGPQLRGFLDMSICKNLGGDQATVYLAQRSLPPCLSELFAGNMWWDSWFEGSRLVV